MANPSPHELFKAFYPGDLRGRFPLYTTTLRAGYERSYWCYNLLEADRLCSKYGHTRQQLFGAALHDPNLALPIARKRRGGAALGNIRGCEASVIALPALWVEIPFAGPAARRAATGRAAPGPDLDQALELLEAVDLRPSIVISDAGGVRAFWLFDRLWRFDLEHQVAPEARQRNIVVVDPDAARAFLRRLAWAVDRRAGERGLSIDRGAGAGRLAAAFPVPGSVRRAGGPKAKILTFPMAAGDTRYRRRDFESLPEAPPERPRPWHRVLAPPAGPGRARRIHDLAPIARGCSWLRHCHTDRETLEEEELDKVTRLLSQCHAPGADAAGLIHEVHDGHPGYDRFDVERRIAEAVRAPGEAVTCDEIGGLPGAGARHCSTCPHHGRIRAPVELGLAVPVELALAVPAEPAAAVAVSAAGASAAPSGPTDTGVGTRARIVITTEQHEVNDQALAALAAAGMLFERAGSLVERISAPGAAPAFRPVRAPRLRELLSRHCAFVTEHGGRLRPASPPHWTTGALLARGSWPGLPSLWAELPAAVAFAGAPAPAAEGAAGAERLLAGLAELLPTLGGAATARRITAALAADSGRFPALAAAFTGLAPGLAPGDPPAATALGLRLRGLKGRVFAGRAAVEVRRARDGIVWAVRRVPAAAPEEEAA